ncbi:MAG: hypothetical protein Q8P30_04790 [Candidatus Uhrbacteria bacterium]|nr:hypothetical protein [Candidatus Uhrbacteria bacterium]
MTLRIGGGETPVTFTVEVMDDTDRFTEGGKCALSKMAQPITVRWPLVTVTFNNAEEVRCAFMSFGQFSSIHPDLCDAVSGLLDEVGIPRLKPY